MKNLFNRNFYRFALGFIGILLGSFAVAAIAAHLDTVQSMQASVEEQGN